MVSEDVLGNDHYHHAMANSNAALSGPGGKTAAKLISFLREVTDMLRNGDTFGDTWEDKKANVHGRSILPGNSPESHNALFDVRRGGSRATINNTNLSNQTLFNVLFRAMISRNVQ